MIITRNKLLVLVIILFFSSLSMANWQDNLGKLILELNHKSAKIRADAAYSLGKLGDGSAVPHLIKAADDRSWNVRYKIAGALGKIGDSRGIDTLIKLMEDPEKKVRISAGASLKLIGEEAVYPLIREGEKADDEKKRLIAFTLGLIKEKKSLPFLVKCADSRDLNVRWSAVWAMGEIGDSSSIDVIVEATLMSKSNFLHMKALEALEKIGGSEAEVAIKKYISQGSIKVKREAARALNRMK